MAVTSIWSVKGSSSVGRVVEYVKNAEKTVNPTFDNSERAGLEETLGENWLSNVIGYAMNEVKTVGRADAYPVQHGADTLHDENIPILRQFVTGINCLTDTAQEEMTEVKVKYFKTGGVVAYHGYQSFAPGEGMPETVHEIGIRLAERLWGERFQVIVATHLDHANHLHNHFVLNTVSFVDGKKYHRTKADYWAMRNISDELCREYGLSVIEKETGSYSKRYDEWRGEKTVKGAGNKKRHIIRAQFSANYRPRRKIRVKFTGFIALYFYYLRLIGYSTRKRQPTAKQIYFLYREDINKMREVSREIRFLSEHHIATDEQLFAHVEDVKERLFALSEVRPKTDEIREQIKELRQEARLCENIRKRVFEIKEMKYKNQSLETSENRNQSDNLKGGNSDEPFGGRGRTSNPPQFGGR